MPPATPPGMNPPFKGSACLMVGFEALLQKDTEMALTCSAFSGSHERSTINPSLLTTLLFQVHYSICVSSRKIQVLPCSNEPHVLEAA